MKKKNRIESFKKIWCKYKYSQARPGTPFGPVSPELMK